MAAKIFLFWSLWFALLSCSAAGDTAVGGLLES